VLYPDAAQLPLVCPLNSDGTTYVKSCPVVFINAAERTVVGAFLDDQIRPVPQLTLDGGLRYQQGFGQRAYAPQLLGSAAAVWQFYRDMHLKLNFAQGFRPPVFNNTDGNGAGVEFGGNPKLQVERSESYQAELNARVLKDVRKVRELQLRVDYAYTYLENFITLRNSEYTNAGKRGIHSVEALAKLYLQGDHAITLGYTFLYATSIDLGVLRNVPNHWFTLGAVFNLIKDVLDVNGNLSVVGTFEDPNRFRSSPFTLPSGDPATLARYTDLTYDQLTPIALLQLGARLRLFQGKVAFAVQFYNVLNQHYNYPDPFYDQAPTIEVRPTPAAGFSFFANITYRP
jgi:outer membrane receptor protein involved in Fe transport